MTTVNPFETPKAAVADHAEAVQPVKVFSVAGRIGRLRYIAYSVGMAYLIAIVGGILAAVVGGGPLAVVVIGAMWIGIVAISVMLSIQRCHDFNASGWLSLVALIPLVNLVFWFIPGTQGENRYGAPTPPNGMGVILGAFVVPLVAVIGIVAAIAIPFYSDYAKRAQQAQHR